MATHSGVLAWKITRMEEPGGSQSMRSQRIGHNRVTENIPILPKQIWQHLSRAEEKGMAEDEVVGRCHWLDGHEFEQARGVGDGQGGLACCSPWGHKESDTTEWLNWSKGNTITNNCRVISWVSSLKIFTKECDYLELHRNWIFLLKIKSWLLIICSKRKKSSMENLA